MVIWKARRMLSVQAFIKDSFMTLLATLPDQLLRMWSPENRFRSDTRDSAIRPWAFRNSRVSPLACPPIFLSACQYGSLL
ncbi:hypothetical protein D3C71_2121730 [compost metagenome]